MTAKEYDNPKTLIEKFQNFKFQLENARRKIKSAEITLKEKTDFFKEQFKDFFLPKDSEQFVTTKSCYNKNLHDLKHRLSCYETEYEHVKAEINEKLEELQSLECILRCSQQSNSKKRKPSTEKLPPKKKAKKVKKAAPPSSTLGSSVLSGGTDGESDASSSASSIGDESWDSSGDEDQSSESSGDSEQDEEIQDNFPWFGYLWRKEEKIHH